MVYINGDVYLGEWYQGDIHGKVKLINYCKNWQISCNYLSKNFFFILKLEVQLVCENKSSVNFCITAFKTKMKYVLATVNNNEYVLNIRELMLTDCRFWYSPKSSRLFKQLLYIEPSLLVRTSNQNGFSHANYNKI